MLLSKVIQLNILKISNKMKISFLFLWAELRIHWPYLLQRDDSRPKRKKGGCPGYDSKLHLIVRLQFWRSIVSFFKIHFHPFSFCFFFFCRSLFYCYHPGPEWYFLCALIYWSDRYVQELFRFNRIVFKNKNKKCKYECKTETNPS